MDPAKTIVITRTKPRRMRKVRHFTLLEEIDKRIDFLANERGISRSDVIERAIRLDYAEVFRLFVDRKTFAEVVIATGIEPGTVRLLWDEYRAGYEPLESSQGLAIARSQERAARERRLAKETEAHARITVAASREKRAAADAWARINEAQTRKHLGELAENTKILVERRKRA